MTKRFIHSKTTRLASSYLAIIMALSIGFSIIFYQTSTASLHVTLQGSDGILGASPGDAPASGMTHYPSVSSPESEASRQRFQQAFSVIRTELLQRLVLFNLSALLVGGVLSYVLARKTLRPIEAALDAQSRFASEASHELRTPLTVMQAENESALRTLELSKPARALLKSNLDEISTLKKLSENLLQLAREPDSLPLQPVWADAIVAQAQAHMAKLADKEGVTIESTVPHVQLMADEQSLTQVLAILLENAVTYSGRGTTVSITGRTTKTSVYLQVRDQGPGIPEAELAHIFDRFYRGEQSRKLHPGGHGLGLAIARQLMTRQRGRITVTSPHHKGTIFTLELLKTT